MKRKALAIVLTLVMLVGVLPMGAFAAETDTQVPAETEAQAPSYTDTVGHWAEKSIERWTAEKVLEGKGNDLFDPDANLTRAESMTIFSRLLKLTEKADISKLTDVNEDDWFYPYVETGYVYGITNGVSDTEFNPQGSITREQFFTMFARAVGIPSAAQCDKTFSDLDQTSSWAQASVYAMINRGYLDGYPDGSLRPLGNITRAEVAKVLDNAISDYITVDGTYDLTGHAGIVVVLAKDVKLTGTFNGHIVTSCPDSTLDLKGLTGTPYIYALQDNTKLTNAKPGTKVAVNPAADNVTANAVKVANPPYTPENPYIVPSPGGGGGGGGGRTSSQNYVVTASLKVPFGGTPAELKAGPYTADQTMSTVLADLAKDKFAIENAIQDAFNKVTSAKTNTFNGYVITVTPNVVNGQVETLTFTMDGENLKTIVEDELDYLALSLNDKGITAGLTGVAGWFDLVNRIDAANLFTFSGDTMTTLTADKYADFFANVLNDMSKISANLPDGYDFAANAKAVTGNHYANYYFFGAGGSFDQMNSTLSVKGNVLDKMVKLNDGIVIDMKETGIDSAAKLSAAIDNVTGRNYSTSPQFSALLEAGINNHGVNLQGDYQFTVKVTNEK